MSETAIFVKLPIKMQLTILLEISFFAPLVRRIALMQYAFRYLIMMHQARNFVTHFLLPVNEFVP